VLTHLAFYAGWPNVFSAIPVVKGVFEKRPNGALGGLRRRRLERLRIRGEACQSRFDNIDIEPTRLYSVEDARAFLSRRGLDVDALAREVEDKFISAFIRANKAATSCCAPDCCS
jgi:hypothetical protein